MERGLQELATMDQVDGAFVCNSSGDVVLSSMPPVLATAAMSHIGKAVSQVFSAFEAAAVPIDRFDLAFDTWTLVARDLGQAVVIVVAEPGADLSTLRMMLDIVIVGWTTSGQLEKRLGKGKSSSRMDLLSAANLDDAALRSLKLLGGHR